MSIIIKKIKKVKRNLLSPSKMKKVQKRKLEYIQENVLPKSGPLISIVMTVYNREKFIKDAINSVLDQGYKNFELIIVNDGSTDSSEKIIKEFEIKDERIKYFYKDNTGQLDTFKYAYGKANGEFITRLDSDDIMDKDFVAICVNEIIKDKDLSFIYFDLLNIDENNKYWFESNLKNYINGKEVLTEVFKNFHSVIPDVAFWRKDYIKNIEKYYIEENIPFYINTISNVKFKYIPLPLYWYRHHNNNYASNVKNLKLVLEGINKTIKFIISNYNLDMYLDESDLNDPYYSIAKRYYSEATKYITGTFGSYNFNANDKVFDVFLEEAKVWVEKAESSGARNKLKEDIDNIQKGISQ